MFSKTSVSFIASLRRYTIQTNNNIIATTRKNLKKWPNREVSFFSTTDSHRRYTSSLMMTTIDEDEVVVDKSKWNIPGLKKEVARLVLRSHKKVGKANTRLTKAREIVEELKTDPNATLEELEKCPNVDAIDLEHRELIGRLKKLNQLGEMLQGVKNKQKPTALEEHVASLVLELGINDEPPPKQERGPKKAKGPKVMASMRLPYRRYYTIDKTEIRVGKAAEDNDELSCSSEHRDGADWWMHASGCPGSHVVIRSHDNLTEEVVQDGAALAARQSKCSGGKIKVSLTRCRNVKKPYGAKAGLVQLTGDIRTIPVTMSEAEVRLERLDSTCLVN